MVLFERHCGRILACIGGRLGRTVLIMRNPEIMRNENSVHQQGIRHRGKSLCVRLEVDHSGKVKAKRTREA